MHCLQCIIITYRNIAKINDSDFYSLTTQRVTEILDGDADILLSFLPFFNDEKKLAQQASVNVNENQIHDINNLSIEDGGEASIAQEVMSNDNNNDISMELGLEDETSDDVSFRKKSKVSKTSVHNDIPDGFSFFKNSLYYDLEEDIEGRIILGSYINSKTLLDHRLKKFVIKTYIQENPIDYRMHKDRFGEIKRLILELFPTIKNIDDWYLGSRKNIFGVSVGYSGCLVNYYKVFRQDLALAKIITFELPSTNTTSDVPLDAALDSNRSIDIKPLTESKNHGINLISDTWTRSFKQRMKLLVVTKANKRVDIRYQSYLNTLVCLRSASGLELLAEDCEIIIQQLAASNVITENISDNFASTFNDSWPDISELVHKHTDLVQPSWLRDFKKDHKNYINNVDRQLLALIYVAYYLTKVYTVKLKGNHTFQRAECVDHFIKVVQNESLVDAYKLRLKRQFNELGLCVAPYIILCGQLDNITKSFVIVDDIHYECASPLLAVESCLKASIALHAWPPTCQNVWVYILEHVYKIRPNLSCSMPPVKYTSSISNFIKKVDPAHTTLQQGPDQPIPTNQTEGSEVVKE